MIKGREVQISGTERESECTRRYHSGRKISLSEAERIWEKKDFSQFSEGKGELSCLPN